MNRNCSACNIKTDTKNYKKGRTVCKNCYKKIKNNKSKFNSTVQNEIITSHKKPKIEYVTIKNNNRTLLVGPSFSGKIYLMLKFFSRIPDRDF